MKKNVNTPEDPTVEALATSSAWLETNKKSLIGITVTLFVVIGAYLGYTKLYQEPREERAQSLCTQGLGYLASGDYATALDGEATFLGYLKIADEYAGTNGGNLAKLYAGLCYAHQNKYAEAINYLEDFDTKGDQSVSAMALYALANCYAAEGSLDKAVSTFKDAAAQADNNALSPMCLLEAGKLLESQGNAAEALKLYEQIKNEYPTAQQAAVTSVGNAAFAAEIDKYIQRASK